MFEVQSQEAGNFSLHVQERVRGVRLVVQASNLRHTSARTFASTGLRLAGFAPGVFAANSRSEPLSRRSGAGAVRCELYNRSRR